MTDAVVANGVIFDGIGGGTAGIFVPPEVTAYFPGDVIETLDDATITRLIVAGILVDPNFQTVLFDGGPAQIIVPT